MDSLYDKSIPELLELIQEITQLIELKLMEGAGEDDKLETQIEE